jgi:glutamate-1-semialdehyde 2,1-aminomutase
MSPHELQQLQEAPGAAASGSPSEKTYEFPRSIELFERAAKVIPCGVYGHLSPAIRSPGRCPYYAERAEGVRFWDVDGNEFLDWLCAYGPMVVGYRNPRVDRAVAEQLALGDCLSVPGEVMVTLAERLVKMVNFADWFVFGKNGSDMTTWALQVAREHTHRPLIAMVAGTYHGCDAWCTPGHGGLLPEDRNAVRTFPWNDLDALRRLLQAEKGRFAAVIMTPYHFPNWSDNLLPATGFWQGVRDLCTEHGVVLVLDDVRTCFRMGLGGTHEQFGFEPDLSCYCKAIANGYPLSACGGREELKAAAARVFLTGSYWFGAACMAAAHATLDEIAAVDGVAHMDRIGRLLIESLEETARSHGLRFKGTGAPAMPFFIFANDPDLYRNQYWCAEMNRRGMFVHPHHNWFVSTAHTEDDVRRTVEVADVCFALVKKEFGS